MRWGQPRGVHRHSFACVPVNGAAVSRLFPRGRARAQDDRRRRRRGHLGDQEFLCIMRISRIRRVRILLRNSYPIN